MRILVCFLFLLLFFDNVLACIPNVSKVKAKAFYGKVIDKYENPISNAFIQVYKLTEDGEKIIAATKTDGKGRFEIANLSNGRYVVKANSEYFTYTYVNLKLKKSLKNSKDEELIFILVPYGQCSGDVEVRKIVKSN